MGRASYHLVPNLIIQKMYIWELVDVLKSGITVMVDMLLVFTELNFA